MKPKSFKKTNIKTPQEKYQAACRDADLQYYDCDLITGLEWSALKQIAKNRMDEEIKRIRNKKEQKA